MPGCPVFSFGMTAYMDSGEKQLVWVVTLQKPLTHSPKAFLCPDNYALNMWLYIWIEFLQDLRVVVKDLRPNQELVTSGQGW